MKFTLTMPGRIVFGRGELAGLPRLAAEYAGKYLVVTGPPLVEACLVRRLVEALAGAGIGAEVWAGVTGEPTPQMVQEAASLAVRRGCGGLIGIGGGSAMDTAKAAAGIATNGGAVIEYLEGVGTGRQMTEAPLPFIAVPTTAGTGAEVTKNAVISDSAAGYKASFRSERLLARAAVVDPELTLGAPPNVTAWSGMDALTQLIESYISKKSNPVTDALALTGMSSAAAGLPGSFRDGGDIAAREAMAYGSLLGGVCLANAGLGAVHGIAAALGAVSHVPHGLACAVLLTPVMAVNLPHIGDKAAPLCEALTGRRWPQASDNVDATLGFINGLACQLGIPERLGLLSGRNASPASLRADAAEAASGVARLKEPSRREGGDDGLVERLAGAVSRSSMGGNPVELGAGDVMSLIRKVL